MNKIRFSLYYEWQQWKSHYHLNPPMILCLCSIYAYFIYRYSWNDAAFSYGNIVIFLKMNSSITLKIITNLPCILFYLVPIIYIGKIWVEYMKAENIMIKVRQSSSRQHFMYGEGLICGITLAWFAINALLFHLLHLSFAHSVYDVISSILLSMIFYNVLLFCHLKDAFYIGWIILILMTVGLLYYFPSILILFVLFMAIVMINFTQYQKGSC